MRQFLNNLEIKRANKLMAKSRKLHLAPPPMCTFNYKIHSADDLLKKDYTQLTHSYTRNFLNAMSSMALLVAMTGITHQDGALGLKRTNGSMVAGTTIHTFCWNIANSSNAGLISTAFLAGLNSSATGIVVGSDDTAESIDDFRMNTLISSGTGAGQLHYQVMIQTAAIYNGATKKWSKDWVRSFYNVSGGPITIREIGCYMNGSNTNGGVVCCHIRDVLPTPITLQSGEKVTITYTFSYLVSN